MQALFGQLLIGLINGAFYAMLSLGLAVIFGLLNIINFTHGAQYMKAKKKPLESTTPDALGVDVAPRLTTLKVVEPAKRKGGGKVADVKELVAKLRNEAKVI